MADRTNNENLDAAVRPNFDYMFKILLVGNPGVGKTAFLERYINDHFLPTYISTVGIDFRIKMLIRNDKCTKLQIWDTSGKEEYRAITTAYYHGAMGFILMFDLTNIESFQAIRGWLTTIKDMSLENARIILVGNKSDLSESRAVSTEQGNELAESLGIQYFETSAKDNTNIKQTFDALVDEISERMADTI